MLGAEFMPAAFNPYQASLAQTRSYLGQTPNFYRQFQKKQNFLRPATQMATQMAPQKSVPSQMNLGGGLVGRSVNQWTTSSYDGTAQQEPTQVFAESPVSHLWDIFGRLNGKRESNEQEEMMYEMRSDVNPYTGEAHRNMRSDVNPYIGEGHQGGMLRPDLMEIHAETDEDDIGGIRSELSSLRPEESPSELTNIEEQHSLLETVRRFQGLRRKK